MKKYTTIISGSALALLAAAILNASAHAAVVAISLDGTTDHDGWGPLTASAHPGYGSFPGSGAWPAPIASDEAGSGDAVLTKISNGAGGGPYPASGSLYYGGFSGDPNINGGTLAVQDSTPLAGLQTLIFQIEIGEAATWDFYNDVKPVLTLNHLGGTTSNLAATHVSLFDQVFNGTVTMPTGEEPLYINTYGLQWDLSAYSEISSLSISWIGVQHAQIYDIALDQSDVAEAGSVLPAAVPEPSTYALLGLGGLALWVVRRYRRTA